MPRGGRGDGEAVVLSGVAADLAAAADGSPPAARWRRTTISAPALKCGARDRWIGWEYGV